MTRREFLKFLGLCAAGFIGAGIFAKNSSTQTASAHPPIYKPFPSEITNGDFEDGLTGWNIGPRSSNAFENQPVRGTSITAAEVDPRMVPIGGDYWRNTSYHIGYSGNYLIKSIPGRAGLLWTDPFTIPELARSISFLIGGVLGRLRLQRLVTEDTEVFGETGPEDATLHAGTWIDTYETFTANPSGRLIMEERMIDLRQNDEGKVMRIVVETFGNSITPLVVDNFQLQRGRAGR